jgi:hypothetical protein
MGAGEVCRRIGIWAVVALYFVAVIWDAAAGNENGLVAFSGFPVVGAIILTSRPRNGVGWFLFAAGIVWLLGSDAVLRLMGDHAVWGAIASGVLANFFWPIIPLIGVLFPSGRPEGRRGRVLFWTMLAVCSVGALASAFAPSVWWANDELQNPIAAGISHETWAGLSIAWGIAIVAVIIGIVIDLAIRWRRSTGIARQQFRWFGFGLITALAFYVTFGLGANAIQQYVEPWLYSVLVHIALAMIELIPITIGIAVTRHGLYEIGRVVSRTVTYALVTLLVVGVYAGLVIGLTTVLPGLPSVGVALATLAAAAVFLPVLRWVQRGVDRAFDRERYSAEQVVAAFGEHLRTEVDPGSTGGQLADAVERTLQPSTIGLWTVAR